jgi:long-chain fatty acid transport protein
MSGHTHKISLGKKITMGLLLSSAASLTAMDAFATEGYFTNGSGARNKAMAGAGIADGRDSSILVLNPAGMVGNGTDLTVSVSLFSPKRKFVGSGGPGFTTNNVNESSENLFAIPNIAFVKEIDDTSSWGIAIAANGGMNSNYRDVSNPACVSPPLPANNGAFCGGTAGINLSQALISVGYAKQIGNLKIGASPIFAFQMFEAIGLSAFGGVSSAPGALSNNGTDTSTGIGGKIGLQYDLTDQIRIAGMYQTKIGMSKFDKYAGLFADGGDFDIPSNYQIGVSADLSPSVSVSVDYKRINYTDVSSVSNSSRLPVPFGAAGAAGFGWNDINILKFGAEWRANDQWTLRGGYATNDQAVNGEDVTLNILAPGVVTSHFTAGGAFAFNERHAFEFGVMYAPPKAVSGIEITPAGPNPGHTIDIKMNQFEATFGWKMKFGK